MAVSFVPNPRQQEAIEHVAGPMLVLAGAGTGKTTVLVERVARLIEREHARPDEILAITFTDNAAAELRDRVEKRLRRRAAIHASTFNAWCYSILQRSGRGFQVLTPQDAYVFLRRRIAELELKHFIRPADLGQFLLDMLDFFDRCHEELKTPQDFQNYVDGLRPESGLPRNCRSKQVEELGSQVILERWQEIARAYANVVRLLQQEGLGTFSMQISGAVRLLKEDAGLLKSEQGKTRFILIDEFQDCNSSNITVAQLLAGEQQNLFAVGDPDQAIYRFRGASSAAFEEFQRRFPATRGVVLEENQRSRGNILKVAYEAINENPPVGSLGKNVQFERRPLVSARDRRDAESGRFVFDEPVRIAASPAHDEEAAAVAEEIKRLRDAGASRNPESFAVLYRQHMHREKLMRELDARGIPFIVKGMDVLDTGVVRDLLAVAWAVCNPNDAESLFRVCALPPFQMSGPELRQKLSGSQTFRAVLQTMESGRLVLEAVQQAAEFISAKRPPVPAALDYLVRQFGLPESDPALLALMRFAQSWVEKPIATDSTLLAFLEYLDFYQQAHGQVPLYSEEEVADLEREHPEAVRLMTVHAAKGLEFSRVWVLRVSKPSFPMAYRETLFEFPAALRSSIAVGDSKEVNEQEECRLFYVAMTRARDTLALATRPGRGREKTPVGFLRPLIANPRLKGVLAVDYSAGGTPAASVPQDSALSRWLLLPPGFKPDEMALSANAVQSYSSCPLKFKLERDWKIPGEAAAAMQFGNAIHTVLKNYYDPQPHARGMDVEDAVEAFRREFAKAVIDDPVQKGMYLRQGEAQLRTMLAARPRGAFEVIATEEKFSFDMGGLKMVGRMDRLDRIAGNAIRVVDYKTGTPKNQQFAESSLQLSIYAMGAAKMGFDARELVFLNVPNNEEVSTTRSARVLETAREKIEEVAHGIAAGQFDPDPGPHCVWCSFRRLCPATEQQVYSPAGATARAGAGA